VLPKNGEAALGDHTQADLPMDNNAPVNNEVRDTQERDDNKQDTND